MSKWWIAAGIVLFGSVIFLALGGVDWLFPGEISIGDCTWGPDYCFASCVQDPNSPTQQPRGFVTWQCPGTADVHECEVLSISGDTNVYSSCYQDWLGLWICQGDLGSAYVGRKFGRGQWLFSPTFTRNADIKIIRKVLMRCGTAACTGGGEVIPSAQGCSWNPGSVGYVWDDGTTGAKSIPFGTGYRYVCSQHIIACPGTCTNDLACVPPYTHLQTFQMMYGGSLHNAYWSGGITHVLGCKEETMCVKEDYATGSCLEEGTMSSCGTIATLDGGQCGQDSDCGILGTYYCDFDTNTGKGFCKPYESHECTYDWDCSQTGTGCYDRKLTEIKCVGGKCEKKETAVGCCTLSDCPSGWYCNTDHVCEESQIEPADCPFDCCDQRTNIYDNVYKQKTCPSSISYCCPDHTCKISADECGAVFPPGSDEPGSWLWLVIPALMILLGAVGYLGRKWVGAVIGVMTGLFVGYGIYWFFSLPAIIQWAIGLLGLAAGGILIYLFGGAIAGFILLIFALAVKK